MKSVHTYFAFFAAFLFLFAICPGSAFPWDAAVQENVIIFDASGQDVGSYHTGDWARSVSADGKVTFENWAVGSPPGSTSMDTASISLSPGMVAVPNFSSQSSVPPSATVPEVSLYSFDVALFSSTAPGDVPGLSVTPPSGTYQTTVELTVTARSLGGTATIELKNADNSWQPIGENSATLYISRDRTLTVRASCNGAYSPERVLTYVVQQPVFVDSDGDGLPDIWEIAHGLNPLDTSSNATYNSPDSDGDGISDFDEVLRGSDPFADASVPADSDGDGWFDWDEIHLRGTNPNDINDVPTAGRLYEVETILSGSFLGYNDYPVAKSTYRIETLQQRILAEDRSSSLAGYSARIPLGSEAVIRVVDVSNGGFVYKRYIPSVADPLFSDLDFDETDCTGDISSWHEQWQDALISFLAARLVSNTPDFDVTTATMLPLALFERQVELFAESVPQAVVDDMGVLHPELSANPWLAFASHGHRPEISTVESLRLFLERERIPAWDSASPQLPRSINDLMEELALLALSPCHSLQDALETFYSQMSPDEIIEEEVGRLLQEQEGTYLAGLFLLYSMDSLESHPDPFCTLLSPDADSDGDGLLNHEETPVQDLVTGLADPFNNDSDEDGLIDSEDNCPQVANPDQRDNDQDTLGDACDQDDDNDTLSDGLEMLIGSNPFNEDSDGNTINDGEQWRDGSHPGIAVYITDMLSPTNQPDQTISGYRYPGAAVSVFVGASNTGIPVVETGETDWSLPLSGFAEGSYLLTVRASAGDLSGRDTAMLVIDFTAPVVTISSPVEGSIAASDTPLFSYSADAGTSDVLLDGVSLAIASGEQLPRLEMGSHSVRVEVTDDAGNTGFDEVSFSIDESSLDRLIAVSSSTVDFGVLAGGVPAEETITVTNDGQTPVTVGTVASVDPLASPFAVGAEDCSGKTLAHAETCTVTIQALLNAAGSYTDTFDLPNNDPDRNPLTISISAEMEDSFPWLLFLPAVLSGR